MMLKYNNIFDIDDRKKKTVLAIDENGKFLTVFDFLDFENKFRKIISSRTLIFILTTNTIPSLKGYIASLRNGIVPLLLDSKIDKDLLDRLISIYQPEFIWGAPANIDCKFIDTQLGETGYTLLKNSNPNFEKPELNDKLGLLLTTSGSTGSPKLVRQSYENIESNAKSIVHYLELDNQERPITILPMSYTYGLSIINSHLYSGGILLLTEKSIMQKEFWTFFKEQKATSISGVPFTYDMLKKLRFFKMDLPSLKYMTQAGGKLEPSLHREFAEYANDKGKKFFAMYGQTEATARMSYLPWNKSLEKYGSIGIAIPDGELSLIDINGEKISAPEIVGELVYKGKNVTFGYAENRKDLNRGDDRKGILITGDMAKKDEDGYYYIVGRKKRFLKIFGNRVNLDEIESMIKRNFDIEVAATGEDDKLKIFIVSEKYLEEVRKFISEKTGILAKMISVFYIKEIPKNDSGKVMYKDLK